MSTRKHDIAEMKRRIYRRIGIRSALLAVWAAGLLFVAFGDEVELMRETYFYMSFALFAVWAVYLVRDLRVLRDDELLLKHAVERNDERNVLITYKATRSTAVVLLCIIPVAICVLSACGMQEASNTLAVVAAAFGIAYTAFWSYLSKTC